MSATATTATTTDTAIAAGVTLDDLIPVRRGESLRVHLAYRGFDGEFVALCGKVNGNGVHRSPNKITCSACTAAREAIERNDVKLGLIDEPTTAGVTPLARYVEGFVRQADVVELTGVRTNRVTVIRRDTGAVIGTVGKVVGVDGAAGLWSPRSTRGGLYVGDICHRRSEAVDRLIDRAVLLDVDEAEAVAARDAREAEVDVAPGGELVSMVRGGEGPELDVYRMPDGTHRLDYRDGVIVSGATEDEVNDALEALANEPTCECVHTCAEDPATACSLSGEFHVHPDQLCPVHPDAPGDHPGPPGSAYPAGTSAADVDRLEALRAASGLPRRGGHPGPARRSTSVRFNGGQYAAIDYAVERGFADGLNAVLARLVDEHLDNAPLRFVIDETCPSCGYPERWYRPDLSAFGCSKCTYRGTTRTS